MGCMQSSQEKVEESSTRVQTEHGKNVHVAGRLDSRMSLQSPSMQGPLVMSSSPSSGSIGDGGRRTGLMTIEDVQQVANLRSFTYPELKVATKNFRQDSKLGEGGFGSVYKGWIDQGQGQRQGRSVAVKQLNKEGLQGHKEWLAEVQILGTLHHPNLVKLIGFCAEDDQRLLVYEYMPRGSLEPHLFRRGAIPLSWTTRMKIALGAARGLAYLHEEAQHEVIYRDLKTSNILLDHDFTAKLSDFGLAKDGPEGDKTHVSTRVMGTYGYAAPEYVMTGHLTAKSDVYSFGVVLLEMLTGRRSMDKNRPSGEHNLVEWARQYLGDRRRLFKLIDPRLEGQYSIKGAQKAISLASSCLNRDPKSRPLMSDVVEHLKLLQDLNDMASPNTAAPASSLSSYGPRMPNAPTISQHNHGHLQPNKHGKGSVGIVGEKLNIGGGASTLSQKSSSSGARI